MQSTVVVPPKQRCDRREGWSGPLRWQRDVQHASSVADPKCAFRKQSLDTLNEQLCGTVTTLVREHAIPRLSERYVAMGSANSTAFDVDLADRLTTLVISGDSESATTLLNDLISAGISLDVALLDVMCECEQLIESRLVQRRCTGIDATLGICLLRNLALALVHHHGAPPPLVAPLTAPRRACILAAPNDTLRFAPILHECYLHMAGWSIQKLEGLSPAAMRSCMWEHTPDTVVCVLNEPRLRASTVALLGRLRVGYGASEGPFFIGVGAGFAGCERWPCQAELNAVASEPAETVLLATHSRCCGA